MHIGELNPHLYGNPCYVWAPIAMKLQVCHYSLTKNKLNAKQMSIKGNVFHMFCNDKKYMIKMCDCQSHI